MVFFSDFDFLLLRDTLSHIYKTRFNWKTDWKSFMNSNLSLIKFNVSATSGLSNIKPIFNLLPHAVDNSWSVFAQVSLISVLSSCSVVGSEGRRYCPSQNPTRRNASVSDQVNSEAIP
jgi:hypothetical protein